MVEGEEVILRINIADMTKAPPLIIQILLQGLPFPSATCDGKMVDDCWAETIAPKERAEAIIDLLKSKEIRAETRAYPSRR